METTKGIKKTLTNKRALEKFAAVTLFPDSNSVLHYDSDKTDGQEVLPEDLTRMFKTGVCVIQTAANTFVRPTHIEPGTTGVAVKVMTISSNTAAFITYYSKDYTS